MGSKAATTKTSLWGLRQARGGGVGGKEKGRRKGLVALTILWFYPQPSQTCSQGLNQADKRAVVATLAAAVMVTVTGGSESQG